MENVAQQTNIAEDPSASDTNSVVDRQKDTVEDPPTDGINNVADRQKDTVEDPPPPTSCSNNVLVRQRATIDDPQSRDVNNIVDRQKDTVEDPPTSSVSNVVDRQKDTVEDPPTSGVSNVVDRQKDTVEGPPTSGVSNVVDRQKDTVENPPTSGVSNVVDQQKDTVEDPPTNGLSNVVDRQKDTVEDPPISAETGVVDRQKDTVEDSLVSGGSKNVDGLADRLDERCNIVDRKKDTVEETSEGEVVNHRQVTVQTKWRIVFHIQEVPNQALLKGIPTTSQLWGWNSEVVFGRGENVNIFLNDDRTSKNHLGLTGQILPNAQACFTVRNLSHTKGLTVNDLNLPAKDPQSVVVKSGDSITFASFTFKLEIIPGENTEIFVLDFVFPQQRHQNGFSSGHHPQNMISTSPGVISPGFHGVVYGPSGMPGVMPGIIPGAVHVIPGPMNNGMVAPQAQGLHATHAPLLKSRSFPEQQFNYTYYPPGDYIQIPHDALKFFVENQDKVNFVKMDDFRFLSQEAVGVWRELGRALGLPEHRLTTIHLDNIKHSEKCFQMLLSWFYMNPYNATNEVLHKALSDPTVGRADLAKKYCSPKSDHEDTENDSDAAETT